MRDLNIFKLEFDPHPTDRYPHGYWYASVALGFDADGATPEAAMAKLIIVMAEAWEAAHERP